MTRACRWKAKIPYRSDRESGMSTFRDLSGLTFGRLLVLSRNHHLRCSKPS